MTSTNDKTNEPVSIGVIGCGLIASCVITGFVKTQANPSENTPKITSISLSKRSEQKSSALKEAYPDLISVYENNQEVLDKSDIVLLCVLNNQTDAVLGPLKFNTERHTLVSMVATSKLEHLKELTKLGPDHIFKMICLPSIAKQEGCALFVPKTTPQQKTANPKIATILHFLGECGGFVECETEEIMNLMITPTCLMGPFYAMLRQNQEWLVGHGVPESDATFFIGRQYASMMADAERGCKSNPKIFEELVVEQTPGGLNEQALSNLTKLGIYGAYDKAMEAVLSRLHGDSDGSLPEESNDKKRKASK